MNKFSFGASAYLVISLLVSCSSNTNHVAKEEESLVFEIKNLTDSEYPDNPDIGFRASDYQSEFFERGEISTTDSLMLVNFNFYGKNTDTITLDAINLVEFIPTIPEHVKSDEYLSYISCVNQEWNRNQVKFKPHQFLSNNNKIVRVDIARNCLNSYLWEIILFTNENGNILPYAHGWFDFPHQMYAQLFEQKNKVPFEVYRAPLENWIDIENKKVDFSILRTIHKMVPVHSKDLSDKMYPLEGARKKKFKEIIYPETFSSMKSLQSDSSLFATFSPPGFYNKADPRRTELGRFFKLDSVFLYTITTTGSNKNTYEIQLNFQHKDTKEKTCLVIGGITFDEIPVLPVDKVNDGWKSSMGIGNHTFYETYNRHLADQANTSGYYAMLIDAEGNWLDSHKVGIDGPLFHFSEKDKSTLNLWLLSFERHALVGHYEIKIN